MWILWDIGSIFIQLIWVNLWIFLLKEMEFWIYRFVGYLPYGGKCPLKQSMKIDTP